MLHAATAHLQRRLVWMFVALGFIGFTAFLLALRLPEVTEGLNPVPVILQRRRPARGNGAVPQPAPAVLLEPDDDLVVPFPAPAGEMAPEPEPATTTPDPAAAGTTQETIYDIDSVPHKTETVREGRRRMQKLPVQEGAIFVSISSYRDENCKQTLAQIFSKCKHCDRIHIGLVEQRDNSDTPCELGPEHAQYRGQMRVIRLHSSLARGPTYARYMTSRLWQGEQYFMQIDAHLNFIDRWDERLLNMVPHMPSKKFVISHYPVATVQELETPGNAVPFICDAKFDDYMQGLFSQDSSWYSKEQHGGRPQASPFIGAGFLFAPSSILWDAPFDRYLDFLFHGEEFVHAARLWTAGYELVVPLENICNHVYGHRKFNAYVDNPASSALAEEARIRVRYLLGMSSDKPAHMEEVDDLGLGHERTFDAYLEYTGVDWRNKRIDKRCDQQYDWDTRQWYLSDDVVPKGPRPYKRTVVNRIDTWPEFTEPAADFADRVRHAKVQPGAIFVSIGSYRDPLCDPTLLELFTKCDHCDRVYVGLVDQTMPGSNDRPCLGPEDRRQQISRVTLDARQSQGPTHARYIASKLYENEEYYLQIDSHLHFVDHWDTVLVDMIGSMPTKKAVVSTYPVVDTTPLDDANMWVPWICDASFHGPGGLITQAANSWYNRANPAIQAANADPGSTTFLGAGFMFGPATVLIDAPFDRYLPFLFHGEELLYAARLWTHNWDFFIPTRNVVSHLYYLRNYTVFQDNGDAFRVQKESEQRAR